MRIAVDAMGGDHAPSAPVAGAVAAARAGVGEILLLGPRDLVARELRQAGGEGLPISLVHAGETIGADEQPVQAVRGKPDSSIVRGFGLVKEGKADAFVSAGNTGALMAAGLFVCGRIPGVKRPAIGSVFPTIDGRGCLVLDLGAHMGASPQNLCQYAMMGAIYAEDALGFDRPRVGLLNVGTEEHKGNELTKEAYQLLKGSRLNFVGNVEGRDIFSRAADVVVCDGFVGNVLLKTLEGLGQGILGLLRRELSSDLRARAGALLARPALKRFARTVDYREYGGAPLLGIDGVGIKCHGSSDGRAMANGISVAARVVTGQVVARIRAQLAEGLASPVAATAVPEGEGR